MLSRIYEDLPNVIDLAECIHRNHGEILRLWGEIADQATSARGLSHPAFLNMIGAYLSALAPTANSGDTERQLLLEQHLSSRLRQGFDLSEILGELSLLGHCVSQVLAGSTRSDRPEPVQIHQFYARLQRDAALVTSVFRMHMLEDEQREKRFRRLIREVAEQALQPSARPLGERYDEVLTLVMQSTQALSASLLLLGPQRRRLRVSASVGLGREQMQTALSETQLLKSSQDFLHDPVPELEIGEPLRAAGIHSMLAAPLAPHSSRPLGVLLIGIGEQRGFTPRERRHLEALAEQVSFHLESARLFTNLTDTISDLHRERGVRELCVAVLAHDLRGPLATAKMAAHLMGKPVLLEPGELEDLNVTVNENVDRMDRLIQDLLDVSLVKSGKPMPLKLGACDLGRLATEVAEELRPLNGSNPLELHCESRVIGLWSQDSLRRVIWNLVSNASKYGLHGAPITITVERTDGGGRLSVHNQGKAISAVEQANLFSPFERTQEAQDSGKKGWGLGLAMVHACIEAHGGQVGVQSDSDRGTTFYFELPYEFRSSSDQFEESSPAAPIPSADRRHGAIASARLHTP